jgi:DNA repair exonuclease SbcCD nuclease subunit
MSSKNKKITSKLIGCFSDIHLGLGQDSTVWHKTALDFAKWASETYHEKGIDEIIISGDTFHNRSQISVQTLAVAKQFFDYFKEFKIYIIAGNHDSYFKDSCEVNSISILDGWDNIHIVDTTPITLETNYSKTIGLVPWGVTLENMPKCDIMFAHLEISSFYMGPNRVCEHGFTYKDLFNVSPYIISGHFHKRDHRKYEKGEILYLGSPYQHNFGDAQDDRGIYIFNIEKNTFEFIENTFSPKHIRLNTKTLLQNDVPEDLIKNNFISLVLTDKIEHESLMSLQTKISVMNPQSIRLDYDEKETKIEVSDDDKDYNTGNLIKNIEDYIQSLDIENKKEVVDYIKELYNSLI